MPESTTVQIWSTDIGILKQREPRYRNLLLAGLSQKMQQTVPSIPEVKIGMTHKLHGPFLSQDRPIQQRNRLWYLVLLILITAPGQLRWKHPLCLLSCYLLQPCLKKIIGSDVIGLLQVKLTMIFLQLNAVRMELHLKHLELLMDPEQHPR